MLSQSKYVYALPSSTFFLSLSLLEPVLSLAFSFYFVCLAHAVSYSRDLFFGPRIRIYNIHGGIWETPRTKKKRDEQSYQSNTFHILWLAGRRCITPAPRFCLMPLSTATRVHDTHKYTHGICRNGKEYQSDYASQFQINWWNIWNFYPHFKSTGTRKNCTISNEIFANSGTEYSEKWWLN